MAFITIAWVPLAHMKTAIHAAALADSPPLPHISEGVRFLSCIGPTLIHGGTDPVPTQRHQLSQDGSHQPSADTRKVESGNMIFSRSKARPAVTDKNPHSTRDPCCQNAPNRLRLRQIKRDVWSAKPRKGWCYSSALVNLGTTTPASKCKFVVPSRIFSLFPSSCIHLGLELTPQTEQNQPHHGCRTQELDCA